MSYDPSHHGLMKQVLLEAATDFFFLQNRLYPRRSSLEWVGNRHGLTALQRSLLHRGVFDQCCALRRRAKRCMGSDWRGRWVVVDGHNVQITIESAILGRPLLIANDGALRDVAGESSRFRLSEASMAAVDVVFRFLGAHRPGRISFLFDSPMSHSGDLAQVYRQKLIDLNLPGDARAVPVPEREIPYGECVVASSDRAVLEESTEWLDLASFALSHAGRRRLNVDFSGIVDIGAARGVRTCEWTLDFLEGTGKAGDH